MKKCVEYVTVKSGEVYTLVGKTDSGKDVVVTSGTQKEIEAEIIKGKYTAQAENAPKIKKRRTIDDVRKMFLEKGKVEIRKDLFSKLLEKLGLSESDVVTYLNGPFVTVVQR